MEANQIKRASIYSYFYGGNTSFQKFLIIIGVFFLMMTSVFAVAATEKRSKLDEKCEEAEIELRNLGSDLSYAYNEIRYIADVTYGEPVSVDKNDPNYDKIDAYNDVLKDYSDAEADYEEARNELREYEPSSFWTSVFTIFGILSILVGIVWMLIKKFSFNKDGEAVVDAEIAAKMEAAKQKGLEKLNIIAAQIESVEPVVLNGIAAPNDKTVVPKSLKDILRRIGRTIVRYGKIILALLAAGLIMLIMTLLASWGFPAFLLAIAGVGIAGGAGYLAYKKYEENGYVHPSVIEILKKQPPKLIVRPGSDDMIRASLVAYAVYMFGEDQLYVYYQYLDLVTDKVFCEGVHEYFYEDIVGVTSRQDTKVAYKRYGFLNLLVKSVEYLEESISVVTSGATHTEEYITELGKSILDTQFTGMRNLIRDKKNQK